MQNKLTIFLEIGIKLVIFVIAGYFQKKGCETLAYVYLSYASPLIIYFVIVRII